MIRASLLTRKGDLFFSKNLDFSKDWNGSSEPGSDAEHRKIFFHFTDYDFDTGQSSIPKHLSYVLRLEVLRPSLRLSDRLEMEAFTTFQHDTPVTADH